MTRPGQQSPAERVAEIRALASKLTICPICKGKKEFATLHASGATTAEMRTAQLAAEYEQYVKDREAVDLHTEQTIGALESQLAEARAALEDVRDNYDCDEDAHRHGTTCRCCLAKDTLAKLDAQPAPGSGGVHVIERPWCRDPECMCCGARDCPHNEPMHYHHDGCPACTVNDAPPANHSETPNSSIALPVLPIDPQDDALVDGLLAKARSKQPTTIVDCECGGGKTGCADCFGDGFRPAKGGE